MAIMMCPHCGREFSEKACKPLVPSHLFDFEKKTHRVKSLTTSVRECPGSDEQPLNAESDMRPLWKDGGVQ